MLDGGRNALDVASLTYRRIGNGEGKDKHQKQVEGKDKGEAQGKAQAEGEDKSRRPVLGKKESRQGIEESNSQEIGKEAGDRQASQGKTSRQDTSDQ